MLTDDQARTLMPSPLPEVDKLVRAAPPRTTWDEGYAVKPSEEERERGIKWISKKNLQALRGWCATVGWVIEQESGWESGPESGPWYRVHYGFETPGGKLIRGKCYGEFDGLHIGYGGHSRWSGFLDSCCSNENPLRAFTVLYDPRKPSKCMPLAAALPG